MSDWELRFNEQFGEIEKNTDNGLYVSSLVKKFRDFISYEIRNAEQDKEIEMLSRMIKEKYEYLQKRLQND